MATAALPHPLPDELVDLMAERLVPLAIQRDSEGQTTVQEMKLGDDAVTWEGDGARCEATCKDDGRTLVARHQRLDEKGA